MERKYLDVFAFGLKLTEVGLDLALFGAWENTLNVIMRLLLRIYLQRQMSLIVPYLG